MSRSPELDLGVRRCAILTHQQHLIGELAVHVVQFLAQRGPRHGLPPVIPGQRDDPAEHVGQAESLAESEVDASDLRRRQGVADGGLDDPEQHVRRRERGRASREVRWGAAVDQPVPATDVRRQFAADHQLRQLRHRLLNRTGEERCDGGTVQRPPPAGDQPA